MKDRKINFDEIRVRVQENQRKLKSCTRHDFSIRLDRYKKTPLPEGDKQMFCYWQCSKCGGYVEFMNKNYYELGLKHGKKSDSTENDE